MTEYGTFTTDFKSAVKVATTANITLVDEQTVDGVAVVAGDRVLVKDQTNAEENGIYVVSEDDWVRATDASVGSEMNYGCSVIAVEGTAGALTMFVLTTDDSPVVVGTTELTFEALGS